MNNISKIFKETDGLDSFYLEYTKYLLTLLNGLDKGEIAKLGDIFLKARSTGNTIYFAGNGGSAATASHFAQDLAEVGRKADAPLFLTHSLTDNVPFITAVANDYGYEDIFTIQMNEKYGAGDVLVAISVSGNSPNIVKAVEWANELEGVTVALTGFDGGKLLNLADHSIMFETPKGEYGPVEDAHMVVDHAVCAYLIESLKSDKS